MPIPRIIVVGGGLAAVINIAETGSHDSLWTRVRFETQLIGSTR